MRGQISDQDLTDYALNELDPTHRLYVESMLAVSEECRNDVYEMLDVAMLLEQGFERQSGKAAVTGLRPEQRQALLSIKPRPEQYVQRIAALLAAAAALAIAVTHPEMWQWKSGGVKVAKVSSHVSNYVADAASNAGDMGALLDNWRQLAEDPVLTKWFNSEWFDGSNQGTVSGPGWDPMPRTNFEMMP